VRASATQVSPITMAPALIDVLPREACALYTVCHSIGADVSTCEYRLWVCVTFGGVVAQCNTSTFELSTRTPPAKDIDCRCVSF